MEMRALRQRFNLTDGQCSELLTGMQEIAIGSTSEKYRIAAFTAILMALRYDQTSAIELAKLEAQQNQDVADNDLDNIIEGELANVAPVTKASPATPVEAAE